MSTPRDIEQPIIPAFEEYIRQGDVTQRERAENWQVAIGLQAVDNLHVSIWQIHPFREGNTRTTAVFAILYLRQLGYKVDNTPFKTHSWYFRNALVRANYHNVTKGIDYNPLYLERFFRNIILGEKNELKNRYCHILWKEEAGSDPKDDPKELTERQTLILNLVKENNRITIQEMTQKAKVSEKTIKRDIRHLQDLNLLTRTNGRKSGYWEVNQQGIGKG